MLPSAASLALMRDPSRWPLRVLLPLIHAARHDDLDMPEQAFLAHGHGATLYLGNVGDAPTTSRAAFEAYLTTLQCLRFLSLDAIVAAGWRVD